MTSILMIVVVIVIVPGVIWLMMRIVVRTERASRERRREAWRAIHIEECPNDPETIPGRAS